MKLQTAIEGTGKGYWFGYGRRFGFQLGTVSQRVNDPFYTDKQLLKLFLKYGSVFKPEEYVNVNRKVPRYAHSQEDIGLIVATVAGRINSGSASEDIIDFMEQRIERSEYIITQLKRSIWILGNTDPKWNCSGEFKNSIIPIYQEILSKVDVPEAVRHLVKALEIKFAYPGKILERKQRQKKEEEDSIEEHPWDPKRRNVGTTFLVTYEDLVYDSVYPLAETAKSSLLIIRQTALNNVSLCDLIDKAVDEFDKSEKKKFSITRVAGKKWIGTSEGRWY